MTFLYKWSRVGLTLLIATIFSVVTADVAILAPKAQETLTPTDNTIEIGLKWIDNNANPKVEDINKFEVNLCTGPKDNITQIAVLEESLKLDDMEQDGDSEHKSWKYNISFQSDVTDDGFYHLQVVSIYDDSKEFTIHYSSIFKLEDMDHPYNSSLDHESFQSPPLPDTKSHGGKSSSTEYLKSFYSIPYVLQTGSVRYAPMQPTPNNKWATTRWKESQKSSDLSTFRIFETYGSPPSVEYTLTEPPSYTIYSGANTLSAIETQQNHYDPSERVKSPSLRPTLSSIQH